MTTNEKALLMHEKWNGKLETVSKTPVKTREDLAIAYTPGVAEPCKVIAQDKEAAYKYTMKANTCLLYTSRLFPVHQQIITIRTAYRFQQKSRIQCGFFDSRCL